ncbi:MAG: metalloregulator ArsR/SmtB family transcription factor [Actinobacteria bacterium]|nr:metalloregulator ArsR/SmtB family transcription factor [Actinomycetota bacterium]
MNHVFSALSDATRRQVIERLVARGGASATELAEELPVSRQAIAKHLLALNEAGLVTSEQSGRQKRYRLTPQPMGEVVGWMAEVGAQWDARLGALRREVGDG